MNGFMRHIGKQGDRKVVIIFREVPGEPHMCLIAYSQTLNAHIHDALMQCVESDIGQHSESLADALNRSFTRDGRPLLGLLHKEGLIKKVQTSTVVMTPNAQTTIKLDDLNKMLDDMKNGEEAVKKMADIEATDTVKAMRGTPMPAAGVTATSGALGDADIAKSLMSQAQKMEREANGLLVESARLKAEAASMLPPAPVVVPEAKAAKRTYTKKVKANVA